MQRKRAVKSKQMLCLDFSKKRTRIMISIIEVNKEEEAEVENRINLAEIR
jgi:hypothetical protein